MRVAVLGVGKMGTAIARELGKSGKSVILWNRTKGISEALAAEFSNLTVASSPGEALAEADIAITFFSSGPITESVLLDDPEVLAQSKSSLIIVDMGTSGVDTAQKLGKVISQANRKFVDAPVSGSVATIASHQLLVMASGDTSDIEVIEELMSVFAKKVICVGDVGAGQVMKLVVNSIVHALNIAVGEGLVLASKFDLDLSSVYDVLQESVVAAPYVLYKRAGFLDPKNPVAMRIDTAAKDMALVLELAETRGLQLEMAETVAHIYSQTSEKGYGGNDMASVLRPLMDT